MGFDRSTSFSALRTKFANYSRSILEHVANISAIKTTFPEVVCLILHFVQAPRNPRSTTPYKVIMMAPKLNPRSSPLGAQAANRVRNTVIWTVLEAEGHLLRHFLPGTALAAYSQASPLPHQPQPFLVIFHLLPMLFSWSSLSRVSFFYPVLATKITRASSSDFYFPRSVTLPFNTSFCPREVK